MGDSVLKQIRKTLFFGLLFSGASSLSKVLNETEDEIEDIVKYVDEKIKSREVLSDKFFKNGYNRRDNQ
ncbi:MAG TPA: hypothetical protein PLW11_04450 [Bacillota bacterium]|nr:hypothetical protein [Bacillota bacterium]